jgi:glycosyltransferase involved in cell wall biosynthesis
MRILWVSPYWPVPVFGGGTRVFNLIKVLGATCDIDLIAVAHGPLPDDEHATALRALCRHIMLVPPPITSLTARRLMQFRALAGRHPSYRGAYYVPDLQSRINQAVDGEHYDVVIVEHSFMGYYTFPGSVPVVLDQHNVESDILWRASHRERSTLRRGYNLLDWRKYRSDEQRICRSMDLILAASEQDRRTMQSWGNLPRCIVIPNGVDTTYFTPRDATAEGGMADVLFTATMHYSPNIEAMLYFNAEIWPLIRRHVPHATLEIVGGAPPPEIARLGTMPGVTVTGYVPDLRPTLAHAQVVVVPLRIGGGTRLKIVEALAMEKAIVSTAVGCEGLDVQDGRHLLVADEPAAFAGHVIDLLGDPGRRAELGRAGRRLVEGEYDWRAIGRRLAASLEQLIEGRQTEHIS